MMGKKERRSKVQSVGSAEDDRLKHEKNKFQKN